MMRGWSPMEVRVARGEPIRVGDVRVSPVSWSLIGRWPGGGFVWSRPAALDVERDGRVERVPIIDVTRLAQVGLMGVTLCWALGFIVRRRRQAKGGQRE